MGTYSILVIIMQRNILLLSVTACCYAASVKNDGNPNRPYRVEIQPSALSHWGDWGDKSFCPDNSWAQGYQLKVESDQGGLDDDTALDGVRLECFDSKGVYTGSVESTPQYTHSGEWMSKLYCTSNSFLDGIRLRSEEGYYKKNRMYIESDKANTRSLDETAANNIDMHCINKNTLSGNGMFWGEWTDWKYCPTGTAVCGLKTKVQEYSGSFTDDTALNEIILYCCDLAQTTTTTRRTTTTTTTRRTTTTTRKPTTTTSKPKTTTTRKPTAGTTTTTRKPTAGTTATTKVPTTTRQTTKTTTRKPTAGTTTTYRPPTTTGWHPPKNSRIAKLL